MKFVSEYRNPEKAKLLAEKISHIAGDTPMTFMEVCGTHTMAISRFGIRSMLSSSIKLLSGPGCPVCVTPNNYLDHSIALSNLPNVIICTFGDMMRVPGSTSSLERKRAEGKNICIVYSTLDALAIARKNPESEIVFLGVGFETTAPTIAASIQMAAREKLKNYSVLCANKIVPPALEALLSGRVKLDGLLLPGHVSAIIGANAYNSLIEKYRVSAAIAGFEPTDILEAILKLVTFVVDKKSGLHTSYVRAVTDTGNEKAMAVMNEVFELCDSNWRGLGNIPLSGLSIRDGFSFYDAAKKFEVDIEPTVEPVGCKCGEILSGIALPVDCPLFASKCTPENPVGACMVSSEGTCSAYYKYNG